MNLSGTLDQDPKVQERWRGAHREGCRRRVSGGATVNGGIDLVILELREDDDGVPLDAVKTMARRCPR
jgi:hypothetical protein